MRNEYKSLIGLINLNGGIEYGHQLPEKYHVVESLSSPLAQAYNAVLDFISTCFGFIRKKLSEAR